jgi:hypothetical protein
MEGKALADYGFDNLSAVLQSGEKRIQWAATVRKLSNAVLPASFPRYRAKSQPVAQ